MAKDVANARPARRPAVSVQLVQAPSKLLWEEVDDLRVVVELLHMRREGCDIASLREIVHQDTDSARKERFRARPNAEEGLRRSYVRVRLRY